MQEYKKIEVSEFDNLLKELSQGEHLDLSDFDLLIHGGGGQSKQFYRDLGQSSNCTVLWSGWSGPKWTKLFSFIPGQAGLISINDPKYLYDLFYDLAAMSVSEIIFLPKKWTAILVNKTSRSSWTVNFESLLSEEPNYFILSAELDETIEKNGQEFYFYDYTFGTSIAKEIRMIIEQSTTTHNI